MNQSKKTNHKLQETNNKLRPHISLLRASLYTMAMLSISLLSAQETNQLAVLSDDMHDIVRLDHNVNLDMILLKGYSPVSYHLEKGAVMGKKEFQSKYNNLKIVLSDAREQQLFENDPARYLPAYGGYCAYGISIGKLIDVNPNSYKIIDGKTYFFAKNEKVDALALWEKGNDQKQIKNADAYWEVLKLAGKGN